MLFRSVSADVDADVFHLHVLKAGQLVHVLQQTVVLTGAWTWGKWMEEWTGRNERIERSDLFSNH